MPPQIFAQLQAFHARQWPTLPVPLPHPTQEETSRLAREFRFALHHHLTLAVALRAIHAG